MTKAEIREIPANQLTIDPRVQRQLDPSRAARIAADWDDLMVGVITVSHRRHRGFAVTSDGSEAMEEFVVLDGQTRLAALRQVCGEGTTSCTMLAQVHTGLHLKEEAAIFLKHNNRKAVTPLDNFRISLMAEEQWAQDIANIAAAHRWAVQGTDVPGVRKFSAIKAAEKIYYTDDTGRNLTRVFDVIDSAWPKVPATVCGETLYGIGQLHSRHEGLDTSSLVHKLAVMGFNKYYSSVHDTYRASHSVSLAQAAYARTLEIYNSGRRSKRIEV